jgi:lysophospholipase L1-like esterase
VSTPRFTRVAASIVAVVLAAAASACAPESSASTAQVPVPTIGLGSDVGDGWISGGADVSVVGGSEVDQIVMIGDSITQGSVEELTTRFVELGFESPVIDARQGKRMTVTSRDNPDGASIARFVATDESSHSALWIIALGTNDINQYESVDLVVDQVVEVLRAVPPEVPLIWVDTYWASQLDGAAEVNAAIEAGLAARGNAVLARWTEVAPGEGILRSDGVHPREAGSAAFAGVVADAVAEVLAS